MGNNLKAQHPKKMVKGKKSKPKVVDLTTYSKCDKCRLKTPTLYGTKEGWVCFGCKEDYN